jgi:hypothetical protein
MLMQQGTLPVWPRPRFAATSPENNGGVNDPHITIWYQKKNWECVCDGPTETEANNTYDTDRMNLFTWKRLDQHFAYLAKRKTYFLGWQGFNVKRTWPIMPHQFAREKYDWYIRYAMARLAPYYNLIWNNTWESTNGAAWLWDDLNNKGYDPWRRLQVNIEKTADVIDGDFKWSDIPATSDKPYWSLEDNNGNGVWWVERFGNNQRQALAIEMKFLLNTSLAMPVEHQDWTGGAVPFTKHLSLKGMDYIANAYNYIGSNVEFWHKDVKGHDELVSGGGSTAFCLARPGSEYVIYREGGGSVDIDLSGAAGEFEVTEFDPFANKTESGGSVQGGTSVSLSATGDYHVLHLKSTSTTAAGGVKHSAGTAAGTGRRGVVKAFDMRGREISTINQAQTLNSLLLKNALHKTFVDGVFVIYSRIN